MSRRLSQMRRLSACLTSAALSPLRQGRIRQGPASRGKRGTRRTSCSLLVVRALSNIHSRRRAMMDWLATRLQPALAAIDVPFQWLIGAAGGKSSYEISQWLFLGALGLLYLIAFVSLWVQVKGLIGPHGILPAQDYLQALRRYAGPERYRMVPSVLWLDASGRALGGVCALGVICAALLVADVWAGGVMVCLWVLYLSLVAAGRDFLSFQWDVLLLEAGFLAIFLGSWRFWPGRLAPTVSPPALALFLLWWLVFRLTFQSGVVKLSWGDPPWRGPTPLDSHS